MCGRARLSSDVSEIKLVFSDSAGAADAQFPAELERGADRSAAGRPVRRQGRQRSLDVMRWGLVPFWAKDIKVGFANINAKAEGIENKPAFREAFQQRRCLVPVDNFYEWKKTATGKQPYAIALADRRLMALAGLVGELALAGRRMGAQLRDRHHRRRTNCAPSFTTGCRSSSRPRPGRPGSARSRPTRAQLKALLAPYPSDDMTCWPVSTRVGNVKNNDPSLIEPIVLPLSERRCGLRRPVIR